MKYLFINVTAGAGSTGKLVVKACRERMAQGHECRIAYGREEKNCDGIPLMPIGSPRDYRCHALLHRIRGTGGFGSRQATARFLEQVKEYDPDIIWLHNLHGYYINIQLLFEYLKTSSKKIIWTLHDCWAFTGNCPYFTYARCDRWRTGCGNCPQRDKYPQTRRDATGENFAKKKELFTGIPNLSIQVPSKWLGDLVAQSFLKDYPIELAPNTVDTAIFHPTESDLASQYHLENKFVVLGAANIWEPRKGLQDFIALSSLLPDSCQIVLVGIPENIKKKLPPKILALPRTKDQPELARWYTLADVYVSPSVEETFGMTVLEAACCGTTPLVYKDTACQEVAQAHGGICVDQGPEYLAKAILRLQKEAGK